MTFINALTLTIATCACITDLRSRRIPNVLTFGAAAAAAAYHFATGGSHALGLTAAGWVVGLLVFIVPFALRGLGGGDVKLLAALGAWLGPTDIVWLAVYTAIAGAVMALVIAILHNYLGTAIRNLWLLLCHWRVAGVSALPELTLERSGAPKLAYALPIFCGTVVTLWLR
jgi:prepilin peptidase CpaA